VVNRTIDIVDETQMRRSGGTSGQLQAFGSSGIICDILDVGEPIGGALPETDYIDFIVTT